ncbi:MAG TPA: hypothetical protein VLH56_08505 [Dissulfurispiraceae bacterium]|nr:hypothetical protein [Dissulfurispiraceae bacterium]
MAGLVEYLQREIGEYLRGKKGKHEEHINLNLDWEGFFESECWRELKEEWKRQEDMAVERVLIGKGEERDKFSGAALAYRDMGLIEEQILQEQEEFLKRREKETGHEQTTDGS